MPHVGWTIQRPFRYHQGLPREQYDGQNRNTPKNQGQNSGSTQQLSYDSEVHVHHTAEVIGRILTNKRT